MNIKLIAAMSSLLIGVSACTTIPAPSGNASVDTLTNVQRYQASVNAQAAAKNVAVQWVNPPDEDDLKKYTEEKATSDKAKLD